MTKRPLAIITCHFNPCGYVRPARNFHRFVEHVSKRVPVFAAELVFDDAPFMTTPSWDKLESRVMIRASKLRHNLWQKEALLNVLIERFGCDFDALAWVDADLLFMRDCWEDAVMRELDKFPVVQMFSQASLLDQDFEVQATTRSTGWHCSTGAECRFDFSVSHPGFAWAARTEVLSRCKLYDKMITGCGDTAMLCGWTGEPIPDVEKKFGKYVAQDLTAWSRKAVQAMSGEQMSFVMGGVMHMWHGDLNRRQNHDRGSWMREVNPETDMKVDQDGILEWTDFAIKNKMRLVNGLARYFSDRQEDGPVHKDAVAV